MRFFLAKHIDDKYSMTNFLPVNVLNVFSKIYKNIVNIIIHHLFPHTGILFVLDLSL